MRIKRISAALGALALSLATVTALASPALADHNGPQPSDSNLACAAAGGMYVIDFLAGGTVCYVVDVGEESAPASHPKQDWTARLSVRATTRYVTVNTLSLSTGAWSTTRTHVRTVDEITQVGCRNHQGKAVGGWTNKPHCRPASPNDADPS